MHGSLHRLVLLNNGRHLSLESFILVSKFVDLESSRRKNTLCHRVNDTWHPCRLTPSSMFRWPWPFPVTYKHNKHVFIFESQIVSNIREVNQSRKSLLVKRAHTKLKNEQKCQHNQTTDCIGQIWVHLIKSDEGPVMFWLYYFFVHGYSRMIFWQSKCVQVLVENY